MKKYLQITLLFTLISVNVFAQFPKGGGGGNWGGGGNSKQVNIGHFYGKVLDSISGKPVEFASIQLWGTKWDTVAKKMKPVVLSGMLTEPNGDFSLDSLPIFGNFSLKISSIGFREYERKISFGIKMDDMMNMGNGGGNKDWQAMLNMVDKDLGNIKLKTSVTELKGVEIIAETPTFEMKLDKKVFNVDKNLTTAGGTAEDVLKNVPSVNVDMDGNVTMRNAAPQIFVDGKPTTLSIDQIPADAIESIELITNPSAKYDASGGGGGILNIVLKKNRRMGYNGNLRAGVDQRGKINAGADLNAREQKINFFLNANVNQRYSITNGTTERYNAFGYPYKTNNFQKSVSIMDGFFGFARGGIDWFVNNRNTFTLSSNVVRGQFMPNDTLFVTTDTVLSPGLVSPSAYKRVSKTKRTFINVGPALQYKHLFPKEGKELTADLNYNRSSFDFGGDYKTDYYDVNSHFTGNNGTYNGNSVYQTSSGNGYTEIYTAQTDYVHPLGEKTKIETGVRGSYKNFLSKTDNYMKNDSTGEMELIKNQSTNYKFTDQVYAAYMTFSKQINKFSFQLGLRGESSLYVGELIDSNQTFKNYFPVSLFPSVAATYDLNGKDNFQLSYSRKINRPNFFQLIPWTNYTDSLNLIRGNAGLKPEFTNNTEFSYLKTYKQRNNILVSVYFKNTMGNITSYLVTEFDTVLNRMAVISTYENANQSYTYGGEFTIKQSVKKWLDITLNFNAYNSVIDAKNIEVNLTNERFSYFTKLNSTFKLPKNFTVQLSGNYYSETAVPSGRGEQKMWSGSGGGGSGGSGWMGGATSTAQGYVKPKYEMEVAVKYEFLKEKKASVSLSCNDVFKTKKDETVTESEYFTQTTSKQRDPQFFKLNFSYRFGKFDTSIFKRKNMKFNTDGMDGMGM